MSSAMDKAKEAAQKAGHRVEEQVDGEAACWGVAQAARGALGDAVRRCS
jgi:hypothetical protein